MAGDKQDQSNVIQQVIQRDLEWARAHRDLDLAAIGDIMSEDYQQRQPDGSFNGRAEILSTYQSGNRFWEVAESSGHHVHLAGNHAIVFGNWRGKGINTGKAFDYSARFLSIYRLEDGVWRMILDQSISIP
jgi:ketosteroid isomerase-like protein